MRNVIQVHKTKNPPQAFFIDKKLYRQTKKLDPSFELPKKTLKMQSLKQEQKQEPKQPPSPPQQPTNQSQPQQPQRQPKELSAPIYLRISSKTLRKLKEIDPTLKDANEFIIDPNTGLVWLPNKVFPLTHVENLKVLNAYYKYIKYVRTFK